MRSRSGRWHAVHAACAWRPRDGSSSLWTVFAPSDAAAAALPAPKRLLDTTDPVFSNPPSMRAAIDAQLRKKGVRPPKDLAGYLRLICDSLGQGHANAKADFERMTGRKFKRILVVGGDGRVAATGDRDAP